MYLIVISVVSFFIGRILPQSWVNYRRFPYRPFPFEDEGKVYLSLKINRWQKKLPDMSRILPMLMPAKKLDSCTVEKVTVMIQETCTAEFVHLAVSVFGLYGIVLWPGAGGITLSLLFILLGNIPYILIQRYNRPRLLRLLKRLESKGKADDYEQNVFDTAHAAG